MRALLRLLLLIGLVAFLLNAVRRALAAGREAGAPPPSQPQPRERGGSLPPERLVCGACGSEFNPDLSGWICPKCGK